MVTNQRIDKLSSDITFNNEKLIKLANDVSDVQLSIEASQEMIEEKIKKMKKKLVKKNNETWKMEDESKRLKDKLRDLKDRSSRDNLHFNGVR